MKENFLSGFFYRRMISHRQRYLLCKKLSDHFRYVRMPNPPSRDMVFGIMLGASSASLGLIVAARVLM